MRKLIITVLLFFLMVTVGCGKGKQVIQNGNANGLVEYVKIDSFEFAIDGVGFNSVFGVHDSGLSCLTAIHDNGFKETRFLFSGEKAEEVFCVDDEHFLNAFFEKDGSATLLTYSENSLFVNTYSFEGLKIDSIGVPFDVVGEDCPFFVCRKGDGKYVLITRSSLFLIDNSGKLVRKNKLNDETISFAEKLSDGKICITYGHSNRVNEIAFIDNESLEIISKTQIEFYPSLLCEQSGKCMVSDGNYLYTFDNSKNCIEKYCDLGKHHLKSECIRDVFFEDEKMFVVYCDILNDSKNVRVIEFEAQNDNVPSKPLEVENYDEEGKRIIFLYSPDGNYYVRSSFGDVIEEFNLENAEYSVELIEEEADIDITVDSKISPDIFVCMSSVGITNYASKGYLVDLWPYIDDSQFLSREDFIEPVKKLYETDGHLFAITNQLSIKGLRVSDVGADFDGSWTVEEFLEWLSKHKDIRSSSGFEQAYAIWLSLPGIVEDYVDIEAQKAYFDTNRFINILNMTRKLSFDLESKEMYDILADSSAIYEVNKHPYLTSHTIGSVDIMAKEDAILGKKMEFIGYPSDSEIAQGVITSLYNMAIVSQSGCKEGAFEFVEFWLKYQQKQVELYKESSQMYRLNYFPSLKSVFEETLNAQAGEQYLYAGNNDEDVLEYEVTSEYIDKVKEMIENARPETYEQLQIREIVAEELDAFFAGAKDAETTAEIIQNRVQLYLDEIG